MIVSYQPYSNSKKNCIGNILDFKQVEDTKTHSSESETLKNVDQFYSNFYLYDKMGALWTLVLSTSWPKLDVERVCLIQKKKKICFQGNFLKKLQVFVQMNPKLTLSPSQLQEIYQLVETQSSFYQKLTQKQKNICQKKPNVILCLKKKQGQITKFQKYYCPNLQQDVFMSIVIDQKTRKKLNLTKLTNTPIEKEFIKAVENFSKKNSNSLMTSRQFWSNVSQLKVFQKSLINYIKNFFREYLYWIDKDKDHMTYKMIIQKLKKINVLQIIQKNLSHIMYKLQNKIQEQENQFQRVLDQLQQQDQTMDLSYQDKKEQLQNSQWKNHTILSKTLQILYEEIQICLKDFPLWLKNSNQQDQIKVLNLDKKSFTCFLDEFRWKFNRLYSHKNSQILQIVMKRMQNHQFLMKIQLTITQMQKVQKSNENKNQQESEYENDYQQQYQKNQDQDQDKHKGLDDSLDKEPLINLENQFSIQCQQNSFLNEILKQTQRKTFGQELIQIIKENQMKKKLKQIEMQKEKQNLNKKKLKGNNQMLLKSQEFSNFSNFNDRIQCQKRITTQTQSYFQFQERKQNFLSKKVLLSGEDEGEKSLSINNKSNEQNLTNKNKNKKEKIQKTQSNKKVQQNLNLSSGLNFENFIIEQKQQEQEQQTQTLYLESKIKQLTNSENFLKSSLNLKTTKIQSKEEHIYFDKDKNKKGKKMNF